MPLSRPPSDSLESRVTTEDSMQCSLVPDDLLTVQNLPEIGVPKRQIAAEWRGCVHRERRPATTAWTSGHIGATAEPSLSNATNARVAPERPQKDLEMTGGPGIRGLRWWAILGLNQ